MVSPTDARPIMGCRVEPGSIEVGSMVVESIPAATYSDMGEPRGRHDSPSQAVAISRQRPLGTSAQARCPSVLPSSDQVPKRP